MALALAVGLWTRLFSADGFTGHFLADARLRVDLDPHAARRSTLESGDRWLVWLTAHRGGWSPLSESARQTDIFIELPAQPAIGERVDLAMAPLQVSYEEGGQALTYVARRATGTLLLSAQDGDSFVCRLDVTFSAPTLGSGDRRFEGETRLQRFALA